MKIKIISGGSRQNTKVINAETGEIIKDVVGIEWKIDIHSLATAIIKFRPVSVELETMDNVQELKETT